MELVKTFVLLLLSCKTIAFAQHQQQQQQQAHDCSRFEYDRCVQIADPLIKEAHLVFPDNMDDIDMVCRTWNKFVDCLKRYTDKCFTDQQRRQFNKAVENPIESVHQMCMQPQYQKEYLQYAPCIKSTITEREHCGPHYNLLVDQVAQGEIISKATLCCSHDRFKQCVQKETRKLCDRGAPDGPAGQFSSQILDKALSFMQDQCFNYIPNSGDCSTIDLNSFIDPSTISTAPSEVYPWSTIHESNIVGKEVPQAKMVPPKPSTTWLPSSAATPSQTFSESSYQSEGSTQVLGSRTRPASYGRSNTWNSGDTANNGNTIQMNQNDATSTIAAAKPDWATVSSWNVVNHNVQSTDSSDRTFSTPGTETWYPAAGNQLSNEVDEPNQQGLSLNRNHGTHITSNKILFILTLIIVNEFT